MRQFITTVLVVGIAPITSSTVHAQLDYVGATLAEPPSALDEPQDDFVEADADPDTLVAHSGAPPAIGPQTVFSNELQVLIAHDAVPDTALLGVADLLSLSVSETSLGKLAFRLGGQLDWLAVATDAEALRTNLSLRGTWSLPSSAMEAVSIQLGLDGRHRLVSVGESAEEHRGRARLLTRVSGEVDPRVSLEARLNGGPTFRPDHLGFVAELVVGSSLLVAQRDGTKRLIVLAPSATVSLDGASDPDNPSGSLSGALATIVTPTDSLSITALLSVGSPLFNATSSFATLGMLAISVSLH